MRAFMMKLAFATIIAGTANVAWSADLVEPAPVPVAAPLVPMWTGLYVGGLVGYAWSDEAWTLVDNAGPGNCNQCGNEVTSFGMDGFMGGFQIGYNYQIENFVLGLEADINFMNLDGKGEWSAQGGETRNGTTEIDWLMTVGPRAGFVVDQSLFYIEGGYAAASESHSHLGNNGNVFDGEETHDGWFIGGGLEYALDANWTIKGEYNYVDIGSEVSLSGDEPNNAVFDIDQNIQTFKVGLSYKF